ncbi:MAG: hypothetical protein L3J87_01280 [Thermoplasmata archaeon]|nr:hypothetical protein [Thermoplasmata archaeon]
MTDGVAPSGAPPPPPPMWMPVAAAATPNYWPLISFWGRVIGFILLFVGTLIQVVVGSYPASCVTGATGCSAGNVVSYLQGDANGLLASGILWALGLFFLGSGAGIKLHWILKRPPSQASAEELSAWVADRRLNGIIVLLTVVLLFALLVYYHGSAP